jgi:Uma2 family endonuclease
MIVGVNVEARLMTFAEFLERPDPPSGRYELHHGELVLLRLRKKLHVKIQQMLLDLLSPLARGKGFLTNEFPFRPAPEYEVWQADIGFVARERWAADTNDYFLGAPDLVIEVLSASNTMEEINDKMAVCMANGCVNFWVVDARRKLVSVTQGDVTRHFRAPAQIPLPEPLQGTIEAAAIFADR